MTPHELAALIGSYRFEISSEARLHAGIAQALAMSGVRYEHEVRLAPGDIIDFLIPGDDSRYSSGIGVEVKIAGSFTEVIRQLDRYAQSDRITALVLVSSKSQLCREIPPLRGKPVVTCYLWNI